jgi:hypothetical protein
MGSVPWRRREEAKMQSHLIPHILEVLEVLRTLVTLLI